MVFWDCPLLLSWESPLSPSWRWGRGVSFFQILSFSFSCFTLLCWSTFSSSFLNRYVFEYFKILVSHLIYGWVKNFKWKSCSLWIFKTCLQLSSSSLCGYWDESYILGILPIPLPLGRLQNFYIPLSLTLFSCLLFLPAPFSFLYWLEPQSIVEYKWHDWTCLLYSCYVWYEFTEF